MPPEEALCAVQERRAVGSRAASPLGSSDTDDRPEVAVQVDLPVSVEKEKGYVWLPLARVAQ